MAPQSYARTVGTWFPRRKIPLHLRRRPIDNGIGLRARQQSSLSNSSPAKASQVQTTQAQAATGTTNVAPAPAKASAVSRIIGPLGAPFRAYERSQSRRPLVTQFFTTLSIFLLGDLSSQYFLRKDTAPEDEAQAGEDARRKAPKKSFFSEVYTPIRSVHAVIIGGIASIPLYRWFMFLGRNFNAGPSVPQRFRFAVSLGYKIVVNQLIHTPVFNTYFFGMSSLLSNPLRDYDGSFGDYFGRLVSIGNAHAAVVRVQDTVLVSWYNSCKFWPMVTAFSFTFVPPQHRSTFAGVVAVGWQTYLGMLNQRAAALDAERVRRGNGLPAPDSAGSSDAAVKASA